MDVGGATQWSMDRVVSRERDSRNARRAALALSRRRRRSSAPARRYRLPDGTIFGIIASTTAPFCSDCDRSRLTADGMWYLCLYATDRKRSAPGAASGRGAEELASIVRSVWAARRDRGAEERLATGDRSPLIPLDRLRRDPHLEMHTRGG